MSYSITLICDPSGSFFNRHFYSEDGERFVEVSRLHDPEWDPPLETFDPWKEAWEQNLHNRANMLPAQKRLVLTRAEISREPHKEIVERGY